MDIDEFLDRETSELGLPLDKAETAEASDLFQLKGEHELSSVFETIKDRIGKGNLEEAEKLFLQLWNVLSQQKLRWNKDLYEQLALLSRQFSTAINHSYSDVKQKANNIYELITRAQTILKEGKKDTPFRIYAEIEELYNSIPNVFFEEKKLLQLRIMEFYKDLRQITDDELVKRVSILNGNMLQLIDKIESQVKFNDMTNAIANYSKCLELYNQIPEGFLRYKASAGMRILGIYKRLSIYTEIINLQKLLGSPVQQQKQSEIQQKNLSKATVQFRHPMPEKKGDIGQLKQIFVEKKEEKATEPITSDNANIVLEETATVEPNDEFLESKEDKRSSQRAHIQQKRFGWLKKKEELQKQLHDKKKELLASRKKTAKEKIERGYYDEASREIDEALKIEPKDVEAIVYRAKLKTLQ